MSEPEWSVEDVEAEANVQRVRDWWAGRDGGLRKAERHARKLGRHFSDGLNHEDETIRAAAFGITSTMKLLARDLRKMRELPKESD